MRVLKVVTPELKPHLESLFKEHCRVDLSIQSILEGRSGGNIKIIVDDIDLPTVAQISKVTLLFLREIQPNTLLSN